MDSRGGCRNLKQKTPRLASSVLLPVKIGEVCQYEHWGYGSTSASLVRSYIRVSHYTTGIVRVSMVEKLPPRQLTTNVAPHLHAKLPVFKHPPQTSYIRDVLSNFHRRRCLSCRSYSSRTTFQCSPSLSKLLWRHVEGIRFGLRDCGDVHILVIQ